MVVVVEDREAEGGVDGWAMWIDTEGLSGVTYSWGTTEAVLQGIDGQATCTEWGEGTSCVHWAQI